MMNKREMFKALIDGHLDDLEAILQAGADVDTVADYDTSEVAYSHIAQGDTLVHVALFTENQDALELLFRFGANLNVSSEDGVTPLQIAVYKGLDDIALWLLDNKADFNTTDRYGLTPLHYTDNPEIIRRILDKGVSVDLKAHSTGYTPLHYAAYHNRADKAQLLLSHGADPRKCGCVGETPLHLLMALNYHDIAECATVLLKAGADINARDSQGNAPLHWALGIHSHDNWIDIGNPNAVEFLLDHDADVRIKNRNGLTPVALALRHAEAKYRPFQARSIRPTLQDRVRTIV
ncbi:MAG: ankyrin repeat domain-containing protein [Bacteroidales bacterium]|nr:ankyrin repeat domain-containing protein [Bacteroidales bacterium]